MNLLIGVFSASQKNKINATLCDFPDFGKEESVQNELLKLYNSLFLYFPLQNKSMLTYLENETKGANR